MHNSNLEPLGDWISAAPWKSRRLILIDTDTRTQAVTVAEKRDLLQDTAPVDLIAIWSGEWATSARVFATHDNLEKVAELF